MGGDLLGLFQRALVLQVVGDARCPEGVVADSVAEISPPCAAERAQAWKHCNPKLSISPSAALSRRPCPTCGKKGRRKKVLHRQVRVIAYQKVAYLDITYGEYAARCACCRYFRNSPPR